MFYYLLMGKDLKFRIKVSYIECVYIWKPSG